MVHLYLAFLKSSIVMAYCERCLDYTLRSFSGTPVSLGRMTKAYYRVGLSALLLCHAGNGGNPVSFRP
jgi:hypothetical protein